MTTTPQGEVRELFKKYDVKRLDGTTFLVWDEFGKDISDLIATAIENERARMAQEAWCFIGYNGEGVPTDKGQIFFDFNEMKVYSAQHSKVWKEKTPGYHSTYFDVSLEALLTPKSE